MAGKKPRLTEDQLAALRRVPLDGRPNKLRLALQMAGVSQDECVRVTGFPQPYVAQVMAGRNKTITVRNAGRFAEFMGCAIEDLFPAGEKVSA